MADKIFTDADIVTETVEAVDTSCKTYGITLEIAPSETTTLVFLSKDELYTAFNNVAAKENADRVATLRESMLPTDESNL